jgi:hypothetical protein
MFHFSFKEWLSKTSPEGAGEIWDNRSNADLDFGRTGARSKYVAMLRLTKRRIKWNLILKSYF